MDTMVHVPAKAGSNDNSWLGQIRTTLSLGIPLIGAQLAQLGIHTTDVVIVGRLGAVTLASMVLATQFLFTILIFGSGFSMAVVPMVAQAFGRGDTTNVRRSLRMGIWVAVFYWLLMQPAFWNAERILLALNQKPDVAALAGHYVMIAQFGILPALLFFVYRAMVSAIGKAGIILFVTIAMLVLNAIGAYVLVLGHFGLPAMGMEGAAVVSVVVQTAGLIFIVAYVQSFEETRKYELFVRFWRPDWRAFFEVLHLGFPIGMTLLAEVSLFTAASLMMGRIGTLELAAHGIALQLSGITFMIPLGLAQAGTVMVGMAHGRGDTTAMVRASVSVTALAIMVSMVCTAMLASFPAYFGSLFINTHTPDAARVLKIAASFIVIAGIFQLVDGMQAIASGLLRGLKDARVPMVLALISYWPVGFLLAWVLAFPVGFGGIGIWYGFLVGLGTASALLCWRYYRLLRSHMKMAR